MMKIKTLFILLSVTLFSPGHAKERVRIHNKYFTIDRRMELEELQSLAKGSGRLAPGPLVLEQMHFYWGTHAGRKFVREALERFERYRPMMMEKWQKADLPQELLAIPMIETGYSVYRPRRARSGAGLWMQIPPTARSFGLAVNKKVDERLSPEKQTEASIKLLKHHFQEFGSWDLAIMAYNMGGQALARAIAKWKTHDAWKLIELGVHNDPGYLAKVHAVALLMQRPDLLATESKGKGALAPAEAPKEVERHNDLCRG